MDLEIKKFNVRNSKLQDFLKYKQQLGWKVVSIDEGSNRSRQTYISNIMSAGATEKELEKEMERIDFSIKTEVTLQRDKDDFICKKMKETDENIDKLNKAIDDEEERIFNVRNSIGRGISKGSIGLLCGIISTIAYIYAGVSFLLAVCGVSVLINCIIGSIGLGIGIGIRFLKKYLQKKINNKKIDSNLEELKQKQIEIYKTLNELVKSK